MGQSQLTQVGITMGTPLYMSPEQIEGRPLDSRSDIYSLGVTAYHMLAGEPPFTGDSPLSVAVQHLNQQSTPLASRRPDVPQKLAALVERMMAKSPADRFSDPAALLIDIHALATEGAQEGWATTPDHASLTQILVAADQRSAATTRLDSLMKTTGLVRPKRPKICLVDRRDFRMRSHGRRDWRGDRPAIVVVWRQGRPAEARLGLGSTLPGQRR